MRWKELRHLGRKGMLESIKCDYGGLGYHRFFIVIDLMMPSRWWFICVKCQILESEVTRLTDQEEGYWISCCWKPIVSSSVYVNTCETLQIFPTIYIRISRNALWRKSSYMSSCLFPNIQMKFLSSNLCTTCIGCKHYTK